MCQKICVLCQPSYIFFIYFCLRQAIVSSGGGIVFSGYPSIHSFVSTILVNTIFSMWVNHFWCELAQMAGAWKDRLWASGGQRSHEAKLGHKIPFWQDFCGTVRLIWSKPGRHMLWEMLIMSQQLGCNRSGSQLAEGRFGGMAKASFWVK